MLQVLLCLGAQPSVPAPGSLVAYFPFDEGVNDVRNAIMRNANHNSDLFTIMRDTVNEIS